MNNLKVEQFYAANQFRIYGDNLNILQSYDSKVVEITNYQGCYQCIILGRDWDYSRTTSKYVYMFLDEYSRVRIYGEANKRKYINDLLKEYLQDAEAFVNKYNFKILYNEDMI